MNEAVAELRALLQKPQAGLRLVHLHLGRLANPAAVDRQLVRSRLRELGKKADAWRLFDMPNADLMFLYQGLPFSAVEAVCRDIARSVGTPPGPSPYARTPSIHAEDALFDVIELTAHAGIVLRYLDGLS